MSTDYINIPKNKELIRVFCCDISHIKILNEFVEINMHHGDSISASYSEKKLLSILPESFVKINSNMIINIEKIKKYNHINHLIELDSQQTFSVSDSNVDEIEKLVAE